MAMQGQPLTGQQSDKWDVLIGELSDPFIPGSPTQETVLESTSGSEADARKTYAEWVAKGKALKVRYVKLRRNGDAVERWPRPPRTKDDQSSS